MGETVQPRALNPMITLVKRMKESDVERDDSRCESCIFGKSTTMARISTEGQQMRSKKAVKQVHTDELIQVTFFRCISRDTS